jgi:hypothetical protein
VNILSTPVSTAPDLGRQQQYPHPVSVRIRDLAYLPSREVLVVVAPAKHARRIPLPTSKDSAPAGGVPYWALGANTSAAHLLASVSLSAL